MEISEGRLTFPARYDKKHTAASLTGTPERPMINRVAFASNVLVGVDALRVHPLRTFLSVLGIIIGAASLVATMSVSDGMMAFVREQVSRETSVQEVTVSSRTSDFKNGEWVAVSNFPVFSSADAAAAREEIAGVGAAALTLSGRSSAEYRGKREMVDATLSTADLADIRRIDFAAGRFFTTAEATHDASVAVLNYALAREFSRGRDPLTLLGEDIYVRHRLRRVVGVLAPNPYEQARHPELQIFVPIRGAESVLGPPGRGQYTPILRLRSPNLEGVIPLRDATIDWVARHYLRWEDRIEVEVGMERLAKVEQAIFLAKLFVSALVGISLLVGGIGIMNVLLTSVAERTREIGIRKAVGACAADVRTQFLAESVAIAGLGTGIGLVIGLLLALLVTAIFRYYTEAPIYPVLRANTVLIALISSAVVGLVFGTYPARRAANLVPIDAITHE